MKVRLTIAGLFIFLFHIMAYGQAGQVIGVKSIEHSEVFAFGSNEQFFGKGAIRTGDLDGNGFDDFAIGANIGPSNNYGGIYLLLVDSSLSVLDTIRIAFNESGFQTQIGSNSQFATSLEFLGDLDSDGDWELAIGAPNYNFNGQNTGSVFILSIDQNFQVSNTVVIANNSGGIGNILAAGENFGESLSLVPDIDNDGIPELAVGAGGHSTNNLNEGAVYFLRLSSSKLVKSYELFNNNTNGISLGASYSFGSSLDVLNDIDGDNLPELLVGVPGGNEKNGIDYGEVRIIFLNSQGQFSSSVIIDNSMPNFSTQLDTIGIIAHDLAAIGDIDGDGVDDFALSARRGFINDFATNHLSICFLNPSGTLKDMIILSSQDSVFTGYTFIDLLGVGSLRSCGDVNGDGKYDIMAGAPVYNSGEGQINFIFLDGISHISIPEFEQVDNWVTISPNPSDGQLTVEQIGSDLISAEIEVLNMSGQVVHTAVLSDQKTTLELDFPSGNYFIRIIDNIHRQYQVEKIIIE